MNVVFAGVVLAIVELITVVLACAYVAQISRRRKREQMFTRFFITSYIYLTNYESHGKAKKRNKQIKNTVVYKTTIVLLSEFQYDSLTVQTFTKPLVYITR